MLEGFHEVAGRLRHRAASRWMALDPVDRAQLGAVLLIVATVYTFHYLVFTWPQPFFIEDSAISFSYARNLVDGEGLVPYPGGERVEGYSNASWTFLLAGAYAVGLSPFFASKIFGWLFGAAALGYAWAIARRALPEEKGWYAVLAPLLLAFSTQFVLWCSSGLENSLFCVLLAAGTWRLAKEIQDGVVAPWSALAFVGLTMTRPDGVAYAAIALFTRLLATVVRRQWLGGLAWIVAAAVPWGAYNAWRYQYFAWWWPNTYYAKEKAFKPFVWTTNGWKQFREYAWTYGIVWTTPLVVLGVAGWRGWRRWISILLVAFLAVFLLWDGRTGVPPALTNELTGWLSKNWSDARVWYLLFGSVLLGALTFGRPGWEVRGMLWASFCTGVFFSVWSQGDWMKGYRWFSLTSVPLFTLMAVGIGTLLPMLPAAGRTIRGTVPVGVVYAAVLVGAIGAPNVVGSSTFVEKPETGVRDVRKRVNYMSWVQRRLGIEHVTLLDVDMGAHMWYSGWDIVDIAGLIDVPISRHKWQRSFTEDYIFEERKPDFAHVHGSWANTSKIPKVDRWAEEYVEVPGYPSGGRSLHVGNHVRKEHLAGTRYRGPEGRSVPFTGSITLEGWDLPAPEVAPGGELYVDTTWRAGFRDGGFRVLAFLADDAGHLHTAEVAPGYDWYRPERWQPQDYVYGRWSVAIPRTLPAGTYDFGFVLIDEKTGEVLPPSAAGGVESAPGEAAVPVETQPVPLFMVGEWRVPDAVTIVGPDDALAAAEHDHDDALTRARAGDCHGAREAWRNAKRHVARSTRWMEERQPGVDDAVVACLVRMAQQEPDPYRQVEILAEARTIDHRHEAIVATAETLANRLEGVGDARAADSDWEGAYRAYLGALKVDPQRSWVRRRTEEVRDKKLGISGKEPEPARKSPIKRATVTRGSGDGVEPPEEVRPRPTPAPVEAP